MPGCLSILSTLCRAGTPNKKGSEPSLASRQPSSSATASKRTLNSAENLSPVQRQPPASPITSPSSHVTSPASPVTSPASPVTSPASPVTSPASQSQPLTAAPVSDIKSADMLLDSTPPKTPSYLKLSCAVSGYNAYNKYGTREGSLSPSTASPTISRLTVLKVNSPHNGTPACMTNNTEVQSDQKQCQESRSDSSDSSPVCESRSDINQVSSDESRSVCPPIPEESRSCDQPINGLGSRSHDQTISDVESRSSCDMPDCATVFTRTGSDVDTCVTRINGHKHSEDENEANHVSHDVMRTSQISQDGVMTTSQISDSMTSSQVSDAMTSSRVSDIMTTSRTSDIMSSSDLMLDLSDIKGPMKSLTTPLSTINSPATPAKDGHYHIGVMAREEPRISALCQTYEVYMQKNNIPEEAGGQIRAVIGKATLLTTKKFKQFRGLCDKNITQSVSEQFPTTNQDLAGFWDLILLQVTDIDTQFTELDRMKENGWQCTKSPIRSTSKPSSKSRSPRTKVDPARTARLAEMARARDEARRRLIEAKKAGRVRKASESDKEDIQIFVS